MVSYRRIVFILLVSIIVFTTAFVITRNSHMNEPEAPNADIRTSEMKNTRQSIDNAPNVKYLLLLEDRTLCAYRIENNRKTLIEKAEIEITPITNRDINLLKDGIYASSYEELFLYFESYTS